MKTATTTVRGVVQTVFHAGATFSAGRLVADDGAPVRFAGKVFLREGEPVSLTGRWEDHPKYGRQFTVDALDRKSVVEGNSVDLGGGPVI